MCVFSTAQKVKDGAIEAGKFLVLSSPRVGFWSIHSKGFIGVGPRGMLDGQGNCEF